MLNTRTGVLTDLPAEKMVELFDSTKARSDSNGPCRSGRGCWQEPASNTQAPAEMLVHTAARTEHLAGRAGNGFANHTVAMGSMRRHCVDADLDQVVTAIAGLVADLRLRSFLRPGC